MQADLAVQGCLVDQGMACGRSYATTVVLQYAAKILTLCGLEELTQGYPKIRSGTLTRSLRFAATYVHLADRVALRTQHGPFHDVE